MLVLKRKEGQWVEITHHSGDVLRFRVYNMRQGLPNRLDIAFDDADRNFCIQRPERLAREPEPVAAGAEGPEAAGD